MKKNKRAWKLDRVFTLNRFFSEHLCLEEIDLLGGLTCRANWRSGAARAVATMYRSMEEAWQSKRKMASSVFLDICHLPMTLETTSRRTTLKESIWLGPWLRSSDDRTLKAYRVQNPGDFLMKKGIKLPSFIGDMSGSTVCVNFM